MRKISANSKNHNYYLHSQHRSGNPLDAADTIILFYKAFLEDGKNNANKDWNQYAADQGTSRSLVDTRPKQLEDGDCGRATT